MIWSNFFFSVGLKFYPCGTRVFRFDSKKNKADLNRTQGYRYMPMVKARKSRRFQDCSLGSRAENNGVVIGYHVRIVGKWLGMYYGSVSQWDMHFCYCIICVELLHTWIFCRNDSLEICIVHRTSGREPRDILSFFFNLEAQIWLNGTASYSLTAHVLPKNLLLL